MLTAAATRCGPATGSRPRSTLDKQPVLKQLRPTLGLLLTTPGVFSAAAVAPLVVMLGQAIRPDLQNVLATFRGRFLLVANALFPLLTPRRRAGINRNVIDLAAEMTAVRLATAAYSPGGSTTATHRRRHLVGQWFDAHLGFKVELECGRIATSTTAILVVVMMVVVRGGMMRVIMVMVTTFLRSIGSSC